VVVSGAEDGRRAMLAGVHGGVSHDADAMFVEAQKGVRDRGYQALRRFRVALVRYEGPNIDRFRGLRKRQSGLITCWIIGTDKGKGGYCSIMRAQVLSTYRRAVRTEDRRLPPEPVLGDSVISGRHYSDINCQSIGPPYA